MSDKTNIQLHRHIRDLLYLMKNEGDDYTDVVVRLMREAGVDPAHVAPDLDEFEVKDAENLGGDVEVDSAEG